MGDETPKTSWSGRPIGSRPSRRLYLIASLLAFALVGLPFWFWYDTWFGRTLSDATISDYLHSEDKPRRAQQALIQIGERMSQGDASARQWYPRIIELSKHPNAELRQTAAWIMGQDKSYQPFHTALPRLLDDAAPLVRRNAALSLAAFRDPAGIAVLRQMLQPSLVRAPRSGRLVYRLETGEYANTGTLLARIDEEEVRAELPGEVRERLVSDESAVEAGQPIVELSPDDQHVVEAMRALVLVGSREDQDLVRPFLRSQTQRVRDQAQLTLDALGSR